MSTKEPTLHDQFDTFLEANPQIAEAMRLFHISQEEYQAAMNALEPRIYTDTVTVSEVKREDNGRMGSRRTRNKRTRNA